MLDKSKASPPAKKPASDKPDGIVEEVIAWFKSNEGSLSFFFVSLCYRSVFDIGWGAFVPDRMVCSSARLGWLVLVRVLLPVSAPLACLSATT